MKAADMGIYDSMYLLAKDQYQSLQERAASGGDGGTRVDGVGGDVTESQVNNIEVAHGGTVLIHDRTAAAAAAGGAPPQRNDHQEREGGRGRLAERGGDARRAGVDRSPTPDPRKKPGRFAAPSSRLSSTRRYPPNAITPRSSTFDAEDGEEGGRDWKGEEERGRDDDGEVEPMDVDSIPPVARRGSKRKGGPLPPHEQDLRRRALANDRDANLKRVTEAMDVAEPKRKGGSRKRGAPDESDEMERLVKARLEQLQGGKKKPAKTTRPKLTDSDKGRKMVHEMRDIFKSELRHRAAKEGLRIVPEDERRRGRKRPAVGVEKLSSNRRAKGFHHFPLAGRRRKPEAEEDGPGRWKRVASFRHSPAIAAAIARGKKRARSDDEEEEKVAKRVRMYQYLPLAGRKRRTAVEISRGSKRRRRGPSPPPKSAAAKRKLVERNGSSGDKRRRRGPSPPPKSRAARRRREESDSDEYDGDPFGYRPVRKRRNNRAAPVRAVGKYARVKRKPDADEWAERWQEEEDTGIPFKSAPVTYDPLSSGDEEM